MGWVRCEQGSIRGILAHKRRAVGSERSTFGCERLDSGSERSVIGRKRKFPGSKRAAHGSCLGTVGSISTFHGSYRKFHDHESRDVGTKSSDIGSKSAIHGQQRAGIPEESRKITRNARIMDHFREMRSMKRRTLDRISRFHVWNSRAMGVIGRRWFVVFGNAPGKPGNDPTNLRNDP
jgi:hypothetical protein